MIKMTFVFCVFVSMLAAVDIDIERKRYLKILTTDYVSEIEDDKNIGLKLYDVIEKGELKVKYSVTNLKEDKPIVDGFGLSTYDIPSSTRQNDAPIFHYRIIVDLNGVIIFIGRKHTAFSK
jgi:hypothetical protein